MARWVPLTLEAFLEHRLGSATFSATALGALRRMVAGERVEEATSGLGAREWRELQAVLHPTAGAMESSP